jgi:hypothetical protein
MDLRLSSLLPVLLCVSLILTAGCTSPSVQQAPAASPSPATHVEIPIQETAAVPHTSAGGKDPIAEQLASVQSDSPVFLEAFRMFRNIRSTEYVHPPYTSDDTTGTYKFDCLGFVDHVLMNATPAAYREIGNAGNPSIESYASAFNRLDTKSPIALVGTKVQHPLDLKPGDVCLWLKPNTLDTGHMWIIAGEPAVNPKRPDEVMVRIFDSTGTAHSDDSRTGSAWKTGLGTGILGFMVDSNGNPVGLYWEGGASTAAGEKDMTIVCGRLTR